MGARHTITVIAVSLTLILAFGGCSQSPEAKKAKHRERAITYFDKGQYHEALIEFKNVVQIEPKDADAHYRLAQTYLKIGGLPNLQAAFVELTKTVELDSQTGTPNSSSAKCICWATNPPRRASEQT